MASIEEAKDLLYGEPIESFIEARDALVKEIRAGGDRPLANEVKSLRKPSAVAAIVNQIVRDDPAGVELILQAAELLRAAQTGALDGSVIDAAELQKQYRAAIKALAQSASSKRVEVRAALEAATIDEASNEALRTGCLVVVPQPVSIFGAAELPLSEPAVAEPEPEPVDEPVDELEQRRARRRAKDEAKLQDREKEKEKEAEQRRALEAREKAEAAREAEKLRKQQEREAEKLRKQKLKELKKAHREAVRAHLAALDAEEAASASVEDVQQTLSDLDVEQEELEQALADVEARRTGAIEERDAGEHAKVEAAERSAEAEALVDSLADKLAALEDSSSS